MDAENSTPPPTSDPVPSSMADETGVKRMEVDIGAALQMLQASPELGQLLNELVIGKEAADELAAAHSRAEKDKALIEEMVAAFEIIAGKRQPRDNLMGNKDIAELMLSRAREAGYG